MPSVHLYVSFYKYTLSGTFSGVPKSVVCFSGHLLSPDVAPPAPDEATGSDVNSRLSFIRGPFLGLGSDRFGVTGWSKKLGGKWGQWPELDPGVVSSAEQAFV